MQCLEGSTVPLHDLEEADGLAQLKLTHDADVSLFRADLPEDEFHFFAATYKSLCLGQVPDKLDSFSVGGEPTEQLLRSLNMHEKNGTLREAGDHELLYTFVIFQICKQLLLLALIEYFFVNGRYLVGDRHSNHVETRDLLQTSDSLHLAILYVSQGN